MVGSTGFVLVDGDGAGRNAASPRHWISCVVIMLVAQFITGVAGLAASLAAGYDAGLLSIFGDENENSYLLLLVPGYAALMIATLLYAAHVDGRSAAALGLSWRALAGGAPWLLVGAIASIATLAFLLWLPSGWEVELLRVAPVLILGTIVTAVSEELLFRGFVLACLVAHYGPLRGVLISAALFAAWHIGPGMSAADIFLYLTTTFVFGVTSAVLALRQGHLGGVIALHFVWNVAGDISNGLYDWPADFWTTYFGSESWSFTFEELFSAESINSIVLPLLIETILVLWICRAAALRILTSRNRPTGEAMPD